MAKRCCHLDTVRKVRLAPWTADLLKQATDEIRDVSSVLQWMYKVSPVAKAALSCPRMAYHAAVLLHSKHRWIETCKELTTQSAATGWHFMPSFASLRCSTFRKTASHVCNMNWRRLDALRYGTSGRSALPPCSWRSSSRACCRASTHQKAYARIPQ